MMDIEFECGDVAKDVGNIPMAVRAHLSECPNQDCVQDCHDTLKDFS